MKKITLLIFVCLLVSCLSLFVYASELLPMLPPIEHIEANNYKEYQNAIKGVEMPKNFVPYERLDFLGEFLKFRGIEGDLSPYSYTLISQDGTELNLFFNTHPYARYGGEILELIGSIPYSFKSGKGYFDPESALTMLRKYYNQDFIDKASGFCFNYELNTYHYDMQGNLRGIELNFMDCGHCIVEADFSWCAADSWLGQFLYGKQADIEKICIEANLRFMGLYKEPWEQPLIICLSAIGGAVVAGVGAWLATYLVMRKKRGAPE